MRAQGAIEYMIIIAAVLGVAAVVVLFVTGVFTTASGSSNINLCREAASNCNRDLTLGLGGACNYCNTSCILPNGSQVIPGAIDCCKLGKISKIYVGSFECTSLRCLDGTLYGQCSPSMKYCDPATGLLRNSCVHNCPSCTGGQLCDYGTDTCYTPAPSCDCLPGEVCNPDSTCSVPSGLLLEWKFDEGSGSVIHNTTGSLYDSPITGNVQFASGKVNTALSFTSGYVNVSNLAISTTDGARTTVTFWMYWDGTDGMALRMYQTWGATPSTNRNYALWFYGGDFGFNTDNGDLFGISSSGLSGRWVFVTAVFHNGDVLQSQIYIDGVKQILTQRMGTSYGGYVYSKFSVGSAWGSYPFDGSIDELRVFNRELTQAEITGLYNSYS